ncbi:Reticulocyte-binding protein 2-like protein a [Frankliniella fusca]|uniref:Reticulocyte-binding protein 2-like protein a n=1 Tax=Frankliniella fusca TaxID=407009 RepID=A0AAE1LDL8_9NEOP|nr:Reticulocyte-binding protein 2-like protein a [Frankliniella fusca]
MDMPMLSSQEREPTSDPQPVPSPVTPADAFDFLEGLNFDVGQSDKEYDLLKDLDLSPSNSFEKGRVEVNECVDGTVGMACAEFTTTANVTAAKNILMIKGHKKDEVDEAVFRRKRTAPVLSRPTSASQIKKVVVDREKLKAAAAKVKADQEAALIRVKERLRAEKEERKRREEKSAERGRCAQERRDERQVKKKKEAEQRKEKEKRTEPEDNEKTDGEARDHDRESTDERQVKKRKAAETRKEEAKKKCIEPEDDETADAGAPDYDKIAATENDKIVDRKIKRKIMVEIEDENNEDGLTITIPNRALAPRTPKRKTDSTSYPCSCNKGQGAWFFRSSCENNPVAFCFKCNGPVKQREPNLSTRHHKSDNTNVLKLQTVNNCIYNKSARGPFHEKDVLRPLLDLGVNEEAARAYLSGLQRNIGFSLSTEDDKCAVWLTPEFCDDDFPGLDYDPVVERQLQSNIIGKKILDEVDAEVFTAVLKDAIGATLLIETAVCDLMVSVSVSVRNLSHLNVFNS